MFLVDLGGFSGAISWHRGNHFGSGIGIEDIHSEYIQWIIRDKCR